MGESFTNGNSENPEGFEIPPTPEERNEQLERENAELRLENQLLRERVARLERDGMTGALRREVFQERCEQLIEGLNPENEDRQHDAVVLLFVDIIDLGKINKIYSHAEGDRAITVTAEGIQRASAVLQRRLRSTDIVGRRGGDEFLCALALNLGNIEEGDTLEDKARRAVEVVISHLGVAQLEFDQEPAEEGGEATESPKLGFRIGYSIITPQKRLSFAEAEAQADPKGPNAERAKILALNE